MDYDRLKMVSSGSFSLAVNTVDSHTAGEPTRLIVDGAGPLPGETMADKRLFLMEKKDHIRRLLCHEPRGHRDLLAALMTEPVTPSADFGLIYMDARRYPYLCGHATIGAVTTLLELGALPMVEPETKVIVDTPSGPMATTAYCAKGLVESVSFQSVPSFVLQENVALDIPGFGPLVTDLVCVGGVFAMVDASVLDLDLSLENAERLLDLGMDIIQIANEQCEIRHPERPEVNTVDVTEFYTPYQPGKPGHSMVVYGERHMDRSPCGTGTTAKGTLFHHRGQLALNEHYANRSPLGTQFEAKIIEETKVCDFPAVRAEIRGSAYITGQHTFVLDSRDPFPEGYIF